MDNFIVLYNPLAGNGTAQDKMRELESLMQGDRLYFSNMLDIRDYGAFFNDMPDGASIIICGGDGTLNRFLNDTEDIRPDCDIYYYPSGSGNDFARDIGAERGAPPVLINRYIEHLPKICVNGKEHRFINGIGYGIDGYCCEKGDELRGKGNGEVNYTAIAIKGLLFHYKPTGATITVDGVEHRFEKVWLAPTMIGRYYGGGFLPVREASMTDGVLNTLVVKQVTRRAVTRFVAPYSKGEYWRFPQYAQSYTAKEIRITSDEDIVTCLDGEILRFRDVTFRLSDKKLNFFAPKGASPDATFTPIDQQQRKDSL